MTKTKHFLLLLSLLLLSALLAVSLVACGGEESTDDTSSSRGESSGVTTSGGDPVSSSDPTGTDPIVPVIKGSVTFCETDGTVIHTASGNAGDALTYPPMKEGYSSCAYYSDAALTAPVTLGDKLTEGDRTVYVQWKDPITYTIAFDAGRGVGRMKSISATYGERTTLPANTFTLKNESFSEWRLYHEDGSFESFVDGARVRDLTGKAGATVTLVAMFDTDDAANFTVENGVVTAYTGSSLRVSFPQSATSIGPDVFKDCATAADITGIVVPEGYVSIAKGAFAPCKALTELTVPFIGGSANENNFIAYIFGASSYKDNTYRFEATNNALYGLVQENLDLSSQVVPEHLKKVTVTGEIRTIGEGAFYYAYGLEKLRIPNADRLYAVGNSAFDGCWQLGMDSELEVQNPLYWLANVETIGNRAFAAYITEANGEGSSYIFTRLFEIPRLAKIQSIGNEAFYGCVYLMKLEVGNELKTIGDSAFVNNVSLTDLNLPDSLTDIGMYAFTSCQSLTEITLGKNVRSIGSFAFADCTALGAVNLRAEGPARVATIPFSNGIENKYNSYGQLEGYSPVFTHMTIYVDGRSVDAYTAAWTEFADRISAKEENDSRVIYYGEREDGSFSASLTIVGDLVYVNDPYGELMKMLDVFGYGEDLGTEYTLFLSDPALEGIVLSGKEEFLQLGHPSIIDYFGEEYRSTVRVRPTVYENETGKYIIYTAEFLSDYGQLGSGDSSLYKVEDDGYGHATLYHRTTVTAPWEEMAKPAGTVYTEIYLYVTLAYDEQYLAVVYEDENAEPIEYRYFFTLGKNLIPTAGAMKDTAMTFLSYGDIQITLDGAGTAKITYFAGYYDREEYVGAYTVTEGSFGSPAMTITFRDLQGESNILSGTAVFDGFFDSGYHRCRVSLNQNGANFYTNTVYTRSDRTGERVCINTADRSRYCFYDYTSEDGSTSFYYLEFINAEGNSAHGTYTVEEGKLTLKVEGYSDRVGVIDDIRMSFHIPGLLGDTVYTTYGEDEDYTFYMSENFYGTYLDYYTIKMDGYGHATLHDEHDDSTDVWYKGTYYNTGRSIGEDDYGVMWVYCFTGRETDEKGNYIEGGRTATYYYVTGTEIYEYSDEFGEYYGDILSVSLSDGNAAYDVYDEKGMLFAKMDVDPFGITELTLMSYTFDEDGKVVYTENKEVSAKLFCTAYLQNSGELNHVVVLDGAGDYQFCVTKDENGDWICELEHVLNPVDAESDLIFPDLDKASRI